jgi:hypothetical protein
MGPVLASRHRGACVLWKCKSGSGASLGVLCCNCLTGGIRASGPPVTERCVQGRLDLIDSRAESGGVVGSCCVLSE